MSRPWQFSDDSARSPFDRQPAAQPAQPPSFQINVNRSKTQKWKEAQNYSYDGDDWGSGYDPYDEYGSYDNEGDDTAASAHGQTQAPANTLPSASALKHRKNSFDAGDEVRSFSADYPNTPRNYESAQAPAQPSSASGTPYEEAAAAQKDKGPFDIRRDFTQPAHVPPPLSFRNSVSPSHPPMPANNPSHVSTQSPDGSSFPPRKSSLSGSIPLGDSPSSPTPRPATASNPAKPLNFVRPADIYKRMGEERERERRSSIDSAQGRPGEERERDGSRERQPSASSASRFTGRRPSLGPVHEGTEPMHQTQHQGFTVDNPVLARAIGAGLASDTSGNVASAERASPSVAPSASAQRTLEHQPSLGFRSVVHQAFDRHDDSSVPPTPISRDNSQSQHGSDTSGISPIMSRVPSTATPESRARANDARDAAVPPIAEETSQPASPASGAPSFAMRSIARKPSPSHSMAASAESGPAASFTPGYRRSLEPPSQESSPARTPELEYMKRLSHPMAAEPSLDRPITADPTKTLPTDYTHREADLADEASSSPDRANAGVTKAAQAARTQFLNTHSPVLSHSPTFPKPTSRATSPSPGRVSPGGSRVRELASQFNEIHALSRSNSSLSIGSKSSMQSWERTDDDPSLKRASTFDSDNGRDELDLPQYGNTGDLAPPQRPPISSDPSFRPHLPGGWVSYVSSADTPNNQDVLPERDITPRKMGESNGVDDSVSTSPDTPRAVSRAVEDVDLTPSTVKQKLREKDLSEKESSPLDAVKAAGDALGNALMASIGLGGGHETKDFAAPDSPEKAFPVEPEQTHKPSIGNVYLRPMPADRPGSSNTISTVGPTPPAKDTPDGLNVNRSSGYFPPPVMRMQTDTTFAEDSEDEESDRLRREIEQSLSTTPQPVSHSEMAEHQERDQDALDGPANLRELHRSENIVPLATPPIASVPDVMVDHPAEPTPTIAPVNAPTFLDKRFSWEKRGEKSEPLFATEDTEPRAPYERPISSQGLHIVNTNISSDSDSSSSSPVRETAPRAFAESSLVSSQAALEPTSGGQAHIQGPVSPITTPNVYPSIEGESRDVSALPSPSLVPENSDGFTHQSPILEESLSEMPPTSIDETNEADSHAPIGDSSRIPPFREILALKSPTERISKYNDTRSQFATMDTGLSHWLSSTLSSKPEHSHLVNSSPALGLTTSNATGSVRQKTGPSIMKIARNLGPSRDNTSISTTAPNTAPAGPQRQASMSQSGAERMQAKGKDFMKSAGMFGGKASFGAKGLFAKAKGKLREGGNEKAPSANIPGKTSEPVEPSPNRQVSRPSTPNPSTALAGEKPTGSNGPKSVESADTVTQKEEDPTQSLTEMYRPQSRNNRLSAAFNRLLADGSQGRAKGRPDSVLLSSIDTNSANLQRGPISPFDMMSPAENVIAPWTAGTEDGAATPINPRLASLSRIGVLPSPAVEKQMTLGQEYGEKASKQDENREETPVLDKAEVDELYDASPKLLRAEETEHDTKQTHSTGESEPQSTMENHLVSLGPVSSTPIPEDAELHPSETAVPPQEASADATSSFMSPIGSVLRVPKSRPSRFTDVRDPGTDFVGPERTTSPVSSLGAEAGNEHDQQNSNQGNYLERTVSPLDEAGRHTQMQPMHAVLSSQADIIPETEGQQREPQDQPPLTERGSFTRPETERKISRSSLPSQQRPPVDNARRTSYANWSSSRRASQVLEPATEGVATPHFESRRNSLILGYGDSPTIQRAPASQQDGYFTGLDRYGATGSNLSAGPYAEYLPTDSTLAMPATPDLQRSHQSSPSMVAEQVPQVQQESRPMMESAQPVPEYLGQQYNNAHPPFTRDAPPGDDYQTPRFAPGVLDPRMQSAEYQLPGVGPPVPGEVHRRGFFRGKASDSGASGTTANQTLPNAARINPSAVMDRQHTFTGDEFPTVTAEKKDKRKSSIFGAFSRSSSISDDWQNRLPSRGSNISVPTAGASDPSAGITTQQPQSQGYANPAVLSAQQARENAARGNTLKKVQQVQPVQRSSTSAAPPDPAKKEKRFSRLGSIFGRRNSQAGEPKRGNRLTKPMPQPQSPAKSSTPTQGSRNASAYSLQQQKNQGNLPSPPPPPTELQAMYQHQRGVNSGVQDVPQLPAAWNAPPPGGWYAPSGRPSSYIDQERSQQPQQQQQQPTLPYVGSPAGYSPQHTTRRLHSEGFRREPRYIAPSPGSGPSTNSTVPPPQDPYYNGPQSMTPGSHTADRRYEQPLSSTLPRQNFNQQPIPRQQQRPGPAQQRPLSWRQSSYGSDNVPYHFDNFSAGAASPPPHNQHPQHQRGSSIGSETTRNLTPTHTRTASFGAAPKDAYRMGNPHEGEQMLQRNYENTVLQAQQDAVFYTGGSGGPGERGGYGGGERGGYHIQPPPPLMGMYEPGSANSSPQRRRGDWFPQQQGRAGGAGAGYAPGPYYPQAQQLRSYSGDVSSAGMGQTPPPRPPKTPNDGRSRTNSLVMINEDTGAGAPPSGQGYAVQGNYSPVRNGQPQQQQQQQQQQGGYYNVNAERRRGERRESGGLSPGIGGGGNYYSPHEQDQHDQMTGQAF